MISPDKIDLLLRIGAFVVPSLVALIVPVITSLWLARRMATYQTRLNKDLEDYKKEISKDLELHKAQLHTAFQKQLYQFQTRYSLLHQKRAAAIETLFQLLAKVQNDLQIWAAWEFLPGKETIEEFMEKTHEDFQSLINFYDEKRIYFDEEIGNGVLNIVKTTRMLLDSHKNIERSKKAIPELAAQLKYQAGTIIDQNIHPVMNQLENRFRNLLSAEPASSELERK
jgi:hypothetical protein